MYTLSSKLGIITFILAVTLCMLSCRKERSLIPGNKTTSTSLSDNPIAIQTRPEAQGSMEFAPQTPNPYSIPNMQLALQTLINNDEFECDYTKFVIRPTHKYIKFKPIDSIQYDSLNNYETLILFDYPLDRKIKKGGTYYRDPNVPENHPNYLWCSLPYNQVLPTGIPYDVLAELYLPESDPELIQYYNTPFDDCITLLIDEAMRLTGNFDTSSYDSVTTSLKISFRPPPKWAPKGTISIFDDRLNNNIPLEGVKVRANRWFETRESLTNSNGFYDMGHEFRYPVDYSIKWERADFHIKSGGFGQAYFNGPHSKSDWNLNINRSNSGGSSWLFGHVHRAALRYFYGNIGGLRRPGQRDFRYWVFDRAGGWHNHSGNQGVNYTEFARINGKQSEGGNYYAADEIYSTTIHETAHSTHIKIMNAGLVQYMQVANVISESYAVGVEWVITQLEYRARGINNYSNETYNVTAGYPIRFGYQYWNSSVSNNYTSLFIDLIDNFNQINSNFNNPINDPVAGYTLGNIENFMKHVYGLTSLTTQLKANRPNGVTDAQLDELISHF